MAKKSQKSSVRFLADGCLFKNKRNLTFSLSRISEVKWTLSVGWTGPHICSSPDCLCPKAGKATHLPQESDQEK